MEHFVMADWRHGYYSELQHTPLHLRETSPLYIDFALLRAGYKPPQSDSSLTYCDLGCGYGYNLIILASCYPDITFYGVDFNAEHIASAQNLVKVAGLENVHFYDTSIESFAEVDLPNFDYIVLNGMWSWVDHDVRQHIRNIIFDNLSTSGAVYVNYNSQPGCSAQHPLRELYKKLYHQYSGTPGARIEATLSLIDKLITKDPAYFKNYPSALERHKGYANLSPSEFAHEFLNQTWESYYFSDVSNFFEELNLSYAASALLDDIGKTTEFERHYKDVFGNLFTERDQEQMKDYVFNTALRKDIFLKGKVKYSPIELEKELYQTTINLYGTSKNLPCEFGLHGTSYQFDQNCHTQLIRTLQRRPCSLGELRNLKYLDSMDYKSFLHFISCLIDAGQVCLHRNMDSISIYTPETTSRLNKAILEHALSDQGYHYLAAPEFGCGVKCSELDQVFLQALQEGEDLLSDKVKLMLKQHETLSKSIFEKQSQEEAVKFLEDAAEEFREHKLQYIERYVIAA